ncbi:Pkinase and MAT1 domain containing protein [Trichuris trichiura]|uniref:N-terminal kinase-like protein n=1 Tax=Trichuris trichiura TaxID=36087 RepID=A0A077YYI9_TRITR|nr:Pkinase and MAT1 domain containing protein [Trichuris trichiura]
MRICPKCKGSDYNNREFVLMVNECGHPLCRNCVEVVFARQSGPCPACSRVLRKNTFWVMQFDDPLVEVEVYFRKKLKKTFNLREEDFPDLRAYNDYLEQFEDIIFNLVHDQDVEETKTAIATFVKEHEEQIQRNKGRLSKDEAWIESMLEEDRLMHLRVEEMLLREQKDQVANAEALQADAKAVISDLMHADAPAELVVMNKKRRLAENGVGVEYVPKKGRIRVSVKPLTIPEGVPYVYKKQEILPDMAIDFSADEVVDEMCKNLASPSLRDPAKDFPYELGEKVDGWSDVQIFTLHSAKEKLTGKDVSVFCADLKKLSPENILRAKACLRRIKTLRHPDILQYANSLETDSVIYIVTERAKPLEIYLNDLKQFPHKNLIISWGILHVANAIGFLTRDAKIVHNNVCIGSLFVNDQGDWKLFGFENSFPRGDEPLPLPNHLRQYWPPETHSNGRSNKNDDGAIDAYGLGCLIWELFNGPLESAGALKTFKSLPASWQPSFKRLTAASPQQRVSIDDLLDNGRKAGGLFSNKLIDAMSFLEEFHLKSAAEQQAMMNRFHEMLDLFPKDMQINKVLPCVSQALKFGHLGYCVLPTLLKIGKLLEENDYRTHIVPCIVSLFTAPDRTTRMKLLQQIEQFIEFLRPDVVNEKIFPHFVLGFTDTNVAIRECTVKAAVHLAPKLNYRNLNTELLRYLVRLLCKDEHPGIRTNATVAIGKIACHLHPDNRQKVLLTTFCQAMKDPFPPTRVAGILAVSATQQFYRLQQVACAILPSLSRLMVDPEKQVREQAFRSAKGFLEKLEKVSENPDALAEMEAEVMSSSNAGLLKGNVPQWASWALSALTSKFQKPIQVQESSKTGVVNSTSRSTSEKTAANGTDENSSEPATSNASTECAGRRHSPVPSSQGDGWEDMFTWDNMNDSPLDEEVKSSKKPNEVIKGSDDRLDPFDSWDVDQREEKVNANKISNKDWDSWGLSDSATAKQDRQPLSDKMKSHAAGKKGPMKLTAVRIPD